MFNPTDAHQIAQLLGLPLVVAGVWMMTGAVNVGRTPRTTLRLGAVGRIRLNQGLRTVPVWFATLWGAVGAALIALGAWLAA